MARLRIPDPLQKSLLDANAGVCCVCKARGIGTHFHHIDQDHSNNDPGNLAVLCVRDHDAHHRPMRYPALNHLDLSADEILRSKQDWELFVAEARSQNPQVLAVLNIYGSEDYIHSMRLLFQRVSGGIVLQRLYHLTDGPIDKWVDLALEEVQWLGNAIKLTLIDELLHVEHCPCCESGLSNTVDRNVATRLAAPDWEERSIASVYVNPTQASLAITIAYREEGVASASLHRCGDHLHFVCDNFEERVPIRRRPSVRTQARALVIKYLQDWTPGELLIGTGDPEEPELVAELDLPSVWERRAA